MEKDSVILDKLRLLEDEVSNLEKRLDPVTLSAAPANDPTTAPARSPVHARLVDMVERLRSLQSRIEL